MTTIDLSDAPSRPQWPAALVGWTAAAIAYALVLWWQIALPFPWALSTAAVYFYGLALVLIPVRGIAARMLDERRPRGYQIGAHIALATAAIAAWQGVHLLFHRLAVGPAFWQLIYAGSWLFQLLSAVAIYAAALGVSLTSMAWARERARTRREHELEVAAREAELSAIKSQFQPHYVLNALNSLLELIDSNPALARTMVVRLSDVMKSVFERLDTEFVPLERELEAIQAYLDVERIRFGSRLSVAFAVDETARGVMVPPFLLQPLVENALKHGVAPYAGDAHIALEARLSDGRLRVTVRDSASRHGTHAAKAAGTGRGLHITRRRLDGAYGASYQLEIVTTPSGAEVQLEVPAEHRGAA